MKSLLLGAMVLAGFAASAATPASAAVVYDTLTAYDSQGGVIATITVTQAEQALNPTAINYLPGVAVDTSLYGDYAIVLDGSTPVDIFGIAAGGPDPYDLAFSPGAVAETYSLQNPVYGTGAPLDMTQYLSAALRDAGDTAYFTASGNFVIPSIDVPEPASLTLLGLGLGVAGLVRRKRAR